MIDDPKIEQLEERIREIEETLTDMAGLEERATSPLDIKVRHRLRKGSIFQFALMDGNEGRLKWWLAASTAAVGSVFTFFATALYNYLSGHTGVMK